MPQGPWQIVWRRVVSVTTLVLSLLPVAGCESPESPSGPVTVLEAPGDCDLRQGCRIESEGVWLTVRFDEPARALKPFSLSLDAASEAAPESVTVSFSMRGMEMGLNRYALQEIVPRHWKAQVTLPICVSGRTDWIAAFEVTTDTRQYRVDVPFVLEK